MKYWHVNLLPNEGRFSGSVFHFELVFPDDYPSRPPTVHLMSTTMPGHPNVFGSGRRGFICLSMLRDHTATTPNEGWTSAYSVFSLLLQLQSFLFADSIPQDYGGDARAYWTREAIASVKGQNCAFRLALGAETHTHSSPWPPLPVVVKVAAQGPVSAHAARLGELQRELRRLRRRCPVSPTAQRASQQRQRSEAQLEALRAKVRGLEELQALAGGAGGGGGEYRFKDEERLPRLLAQHTPLETEISALVEELRASDAVQVPATLHALGVASAAAAAAVAAAAVAAAAAAAATLAAPLLSDVTNLPPSPPARIALADVSCRASGSDGSGAILAAMEALAQAIADARPLAAQLTAVRDALPVAEAQLAALLTQIETQLKAQIKAAQEEEEADVASGLPPAVLPELPAELWLQIFDSLRVEELPAVSRVCRAWCDLSREFQLWTRRQLRCYHTKVRVALIAPQPVCSHDAYADMRAAAATGRPPLHTRLCYSRVLIHRTGALWLWKCCAWRWATTGAAPRPRWQPARREDCV
jgi:ubiquitin-protein ligase